MTKILTLLFSLLFFFIQYSGISQQNMSLLSNVQINDTANDIWGWVAQNGTEYAIMGAQNSVHIYSLADPTSPVEVASIPGDRSIWRDIKSHENFIYVVADQGNQGVLIIDMTNAPTSIEYEYQNLNIQVNTDVETCHNLFIDDGFMYLSGCNAFDGVLIYDINADPQTPSLVGIADLNYAHDVYVKGNTMYVSEIFDGMLAIYDITDKSNPTLIGSTNTGFNFTHNAWTNEDASIIYTTDERGNAYVEAYDISDPSDINMLGRFRPLATEGLGVIPHNTHYLNDFLYTSYYTDGIIVTDVSKPDNIIQVGQYDTWAGADGGFGGNWGAYPFLPSGIILASDQSTGLYVLNADIPRASYLEGIVTDVNTGFPINGVDVQINSTDLNRALTNATGRFKTGQATEGTFDVVFSHPDYITQTIQVKLQSSQCVNLNVELATAGMITVVINATDANTNEGLENAQISLFNDSHTFNQQTGNSGEETIIAFEGVYSLAVGKWGYQTVLLENVAITEDLQIDIQLEEGFVDEFLLDLGWTTSGTSTTGQWELAVPVGTTFESLLANVNEDLDDDLGNSCYVTGNGGGSAGNDDVDNGIARLTSPLTDLTAMVHPTLNYSRWFFNEGGSTALDDTLKIYVQRGAKMILLESITGEQNVGGSWIPSNDIPLTGLFRNMDNLQFVFETSDLATGHLVEAGLDGFSITEDRCLLADNDLLIENDNPIITSDQIVNIGIETNGQVLDNQYTYEAGEYILLTADFEVKIGAAFEAIILNCNESGETTINPFLPQLPINLDPLKIDAQTKDNAK